MVYGRGGAGNITQAKEATKRVTEDLEANHSSAASAAPPASSTSNAQPSEYAHMGRGGAGNWYQPNELEKDGKFVQESDSTAVPTSEKPQVSTPWHPEGQEMPLAKAGRGGAGNFVWGEGEKEKAKRMTEEAQREKLSGDVERDVEIGLQKPGAAVLGGEKAGRGW